MNCELCGAQESGPYRVVYKDETDFVVYNIKSVII